MSPLADATQTQDPPKTHVASLMIALIAASVAFQFAGTMVSPGYADMITVLKTDMATIGKIVAISLAAAAVFALFMPRWSDIVGRKKLVVIMLGGLTAGAAICALAPNIQVLAVGRIIAGLAGPILAVSMLMLRTAVSDPKRFGMLIGFLAAVNSGIAGVDAIFGGWLAEHFGFRSIFWVIAGVAIIAMLLVWIWTSESRPSRGASMDWIGTAVLGIGLGSLVLAVAEAANGAFANWTVFWIEAAVAIIFIVGFWFVEKGRPEPLIKTSYLKDRSVACLIVATLFTMGGTFAIVNIIAPNLAQIPEILGGFGDTATMAAVLFIAPGALVGWLVGPFAGRAAARVGYGLILRIGLAGSAIVVAAFALWGTSNAVAAGITLFLLGAVNFGMANIMLNGLGVILSPPENPGYLPGVNSGMFILGSGISFAVLPAVAQARFAMPLPGTPDEFAALTPDALAELADSVPTAFSAAAWVAVGFIVVAFIASFGIRKITQVRTDS